MGPAWFLFKFAAQELRVAEQNALVFIPFERTVSWVSSTKYFTVQSFTGNYNLLAGVLVPSERTFEILFRHQAARSEQLYGSSGRPWGPGT